MASKHAALPRDHDERFKTTLTVARVLGAKADGLGISKQDLLHRIALEWVDRHVHEARLLIAAIDGEGSPGHDRD